MPRNGLKVIEGGKSGVQAAKETKPEQAKRDFRAELASLRGVQPNEEGARSDSFETQEPGSEE